MRHRPPLLRCLLILSAVGPVACADLPTEPEPFPARTERPLLFAAATPTVVVNCTRSWAAGVDGDWDVGSNWSPSGVPAASDNVCIDAAGTYEVSLDDEAEVRSLKIGGSTGVATLETSDNLFVSEDLLIEATGRLHLRSGSYRYLGSTSPGRWPSYIADDFENLGILEVTDTCGCGPPVTIDFSDIKNRGWMLLPGGSRIWINSRSWVNAGTGWGYLTNSGFILTEGTDTVEVTSYLEVVDHVWPVVSITLEAGSISGSAPVTFTERAAHITELAWEGGTLPANSADPSEPLVSVVGVDRFKVEDPSMHGQVAVRGNGFVYGGVGPDMKLRLTPTGHINLSPPSGSPPGWSFVNEGALELDGTGTVAVFGGLLNDGELRVEGIVDLQVLDSIANRGSMEIDGSLRVLPYGVFSVTPTLHNRGTLRVASGGLLEVEEGVFRASPNGSVSGALLLDRSAVQGSGPVGDLTSTGGSIEPGAAGVTRRLPGAPMSTLVASSLALDAASQVVLDVAGDGPGDYERVQVLGEVEYGGTLVVRTQAGFPAGQCGQVLEVLSDGATAPTGRGAFDAFVGLRLSRSAAWRVHNPAGVLALAGYEPGPAPVYVSPAHTSLEEGGPAAPYRLCLGATAPTASVTVQPISARGQLLVGGSFTVQPSEFALPHTLWLRAREDAQVEGAHADTLFHALQSADARYSQADAGPVLAVIADNDGLADLSLLRVSQEDNRFVGDTMDTVFGVRNAGPTLSSGSTVISTALVGLQFVSASGASCSVDGAQVVTCDVAAVPAGAGVDFTVTFVGASVGLHSTTWTVTGQQPDPDATDNAVIYTQRVN